MFWNDELEKSVLAKGMLVIDKSLEGETLVLHRAGKTVVDWTAMQLRALHELEIL